MRTFRYTGRAVKSAARAHSRLACKYKGHVIVWDICSEKVGFYMRIIDAHLHFCPDEPGYFSDIARAAGHENTEEHLRREYERLGIIGGVVMGNGGLELKEHEKYPSYLRYCIGLDSMCLRSSEEGFSGRIWDRVELHLKRKNCVGIKLYPGYNPYYITDAVYGPCYELAKAYKKPVAVHTGETAGTGAILKYSHPLTLDEAAVAHPDVNFVMCHFGNPWLQDAACVTAKNENVFADISGLLEGRNNPDEYFKDQKGYTDLLITWIKYMGDYQKLMFGTDWPLANLEDYIEIVKRLIPEKYHEPVFCNNAVRIYGLWDMLS